MAGRTVLGIVLSVIGLAGVGYAAFNFNQLFFVQKMLTQTDIPIYDSKVVLPLLLGFIVLLDASIVLGLKRRFSLGLQVLGNLALLWAVVLLYGNLSIPVLDVGAYQPVFYSVVTGMVFFVVGFIVNDLPHRKTKPAPAKDTPPAQKSTPSV